MQLYSNICRFLKNLISEVVMNTLILLQVPILSDPSGQPLMVSYVVRNRKLVWAEPSSIDTDKPRTNQLISFRSHLRSDDNFLTFKAFLRKVWELLKISWNRVIHIFNDKHVWFAWKYLESCSKINIRVWNIIFITNQAKSDNGVIHVIFVYGLDSSRRFGSDGVISRGFCDEKGCVVTVGAEAVTVLLEASDVAIVPGWEGMRQAVSSWHFISFLSKLLKFAERIPGSRRNRNMSDILILRNKESQNLRLICIQIQLQRFGIFEYQLNR